MTWGSTVRVPVVPGALGWDYVAFYAASECRPNETGTGDGLGCGIMTGHGVLPDSTLSRRRRNRRWPIHRMFRHEYYGLLHVRDL